MNAINERLLDWKPRARPVAMGLIGAGQMGQEILCQVQLMKGVRDSGGRGRHLRSGGTGLPDGGSAQRTPGRGPRR